MDLSKIEESILSGYPPVSCSKNITCHKKCLKFSGCGTEIELIQITSKHPGNDNKSPAL